jgi:hypothetical protein
MTVVPRGKPDNCGKMAGGKDANERLAQKLKGFA